MTGPRVGRSRALRSRTARLRALTGLGLREQARRPLLLVLLVGLPFFFITRSIANTERLPRVVQLPGAGGGVLTDMRDIHGAIMAAITVAFLVGLVGVFVIQSARRADRRLVLAGFAPWEVLVPRLAMLLIATIIVSGVSLGVTALSFSPDRWIPFAIATLSIGLVYGLLGMLAGAFVGRLSATYLMLFGAMLDLGVAQNPMFGSGRPPDWAVILPGYGPGRVLVDAAFSPDLHASGALVLTACWVGVLTAGVLLLLAHHTRPAGVRRRARVSRA